jgi:hypothetical protein
VHKTAIVEEQPQRWLTLFFRHGRMGLEEILATVVQVFERTRLQEQERRSTCMHSLSLPYAWSSSYSLLSLLFLPKL